MTGEFYSGNDESLNRLLWESSVAVAHQKYQEAERTDDALWSAGLDHARLYRLSGGANNIIPAQHARYALVPQSQRAMIGDIVQLCVRLPLVPVGNGQDSMPSSDLFVEATKTSGESQCFLATPQGMRAYNTADDIEEMVVPTTDGRLFDVTPTLDTMAAQTEADALWPDLESLNRILLRYHVSPQETTGPASVVA